MLSDSQQRLADHVSPGSRWYHAALGAARERWHEFESRHHQCARVLTYVSYARGKAWDD